MSEDPNAIDLWLCTHCGADYYGFRHPQGLCHRCRKLNLKAQTEYRTQSRVPHLLLWK